MASEKRHNGGGTTFTFDFPSLEQSDIKVSINNTEITSGFSINNYDPVTGGEVNISNGTAGTDTVRIFRQTEPETLVATFVAGSSISANDLNNCNKQTIFLADENRTSINNLALGNAGSAVQISGSNIADNSISSSKILDLEVKTADINNLAVTTGKIANLAVTTAKIEDDAVTTDKLANSINTTIAGKANTGANLSTFTNDTNFINLTQATAGVFTTGMIMMFTGSTAPSGWALCDGSNGTPDLRARFVVGAGDGTGDGNTNYSIGASGGAEQVTLNINQIPSHNHDLLFGIGSFGGSSGAQTPRDSGSVGNRIGNTGGGQAHENRPPYYALSYIMKL